MSAFSPPAFVRRSRLLIAVGCAIALTSACSGSGSSSIEKSVGDSDLVSQLGTPTGQVDTIKWNLDSEPDSLDPDNAATYSSGTVVRNLCDSLLTLDADYNIKPNLATYKVVSPTKVVFTIRDGVKFWDGKPLTAADVAYSLRRGAEAKYISAFIFTNVKSIDVTGTNKVTVTFTQPDELFISEMASSAIMEKAYTEKVGNKLGTPSGGLMCSGPFKLTKWTSGSNLVITRNGHYWNKDRLPYAKTIDFSFITDATTLATALDTGEIDGAYQISASSVPTLQKSSAGRIVFGSSMEGVSLYQANPTGEFANAKVRAALQVGIDREALATAVFHGAASPLYTGLTPATWPNDEKAAYQTAYDQFAKSRSYDLEKAKKLVAESGYDGGDIVLAYAAGDNTAALTAQLVQQQAKAIGLRITLKAMQPLVFDQAGYDAGKRKGLDIMLSSNFNAAHDPIEPIGFTYLPGQVYNYTDFDNPTATKDISRASATFDDAKRAKLIIDAQELYEATNSVIPLVSTYTTTFLNDSLTGAVTSFAYWSMPSMAYIGAAS
ncbi:MAG: ABC transporter substrate-binding protein [Nocardioides sp.]|uniref:ABC transporter substrate-binding protein n=1 Tax=Nocardioides sp. TaxID=35761 RepID=UPI0039E52BA9